jgi:hypothetical protein
MTSTWSETVAPTAIKTTAGLVGMPHVALHENRNTSQDWWEITAEHPGSETILR